MKGDVESIANGSTEATAPVNPRPWLAVIA
jgi:hypothetical protein